MSQLSSQMEVSEPANVSLMAPARSLPDGYVESDPVICNQAKLGHFMGVFGIVGTGLYYYLKRNDVGSFAKDQMKEAFNFHVAVFAAAFTLGLAGGIVGSIVTALAVVFGVAQLGLGVTALVLSIMNGLKAGRGEVARYPVRVNVLK